MIKPVIFVIGMSGSGLRTAISCLEDLSVYCVDNLPPELISEALKNIQEKKITAAGYCGLGFGIHLYNKEEISLFFSLVKKLQSFVHLDILFLKAKQDCLEKRYSENRRKHPFQGLDGDLTKAIQEEQKLLDKIEEKADFIIDTTELSPHDLRRLIESRYQEAIPARSLHVNLLSFGFKHGLVSPVDSLFDVRFLVNPYFDEELRKLNGQDKRVQDYIFRDSIAQKMLTKLIDWHEWILPEFYKEGKFLFRVGIACTGGQHRSVALVENLYTALQAKNFKNITISKTHRDL